MDAEKVLHSIRNPEIISSPGAIKEFISSTVFTDFKNEMFARIEKMRDAYDDAPKEFVDINKGGILSMRMNMNIFDDLLHNSAIPKDENNDNEGDNNGC